MEVGERYAKGERGEGRKEGKEEVEGAKENQLLGVNVVIEENNEDAGLGYDSCLGWG